MQKMHHTHQRIVIQLPDTDVAVLCKAHFHDLECQELWFQTGVKDRMIFITTFALFAWSAPLQSSSSIPGLNQLRLYQYPERNWQDDCLDDPSERKSATTAIVQIWWRLSP